MTQNKYDTEETTVTLTYREWVILGDCVSRRRRDLHDRADFLENEPGGEKNTGQIAGLRRKATELWTVQEEVLAALADARRVVATAS